MAQGIFTLKQVSQATRQGAWSSFNPPQWIEYLVVAGGGGTGHYVGGGGAGGLLTGMVPVTIGTSYNVTVGAGGAASSTANVGNPGVSSVFGNISATGGGAGATPGGNGGSGGGSGQLSSVTPNLGGKGVSGQGNAGGNYAYIGAGTSNYVGGGGGGGAGTAGQNGFKLRGGRGGAGIASDISGTSTLYAGGGGGSGYADGGPVLPGVGGVGGGGTGGYNTATAGSVNTGGGGGGGAPGYTGAAGGSGIVIVRYPGNVVFYTGGTVNYNNGYISHIFNSNGTLAPTAPAPYNTSYQISRSLRFNSADSANLSRTFGTPTNANVWTFSCWLKRGVLGTDGTILGRSGSLYPVYCFNATTNTFGVFDSGSASTTAVFRDPSAWYHLVIQRTNSTTVTVYFNGVSQLTTAGQTNAFNLSGETYTIGKSDAGEYFDGYITEVNFIDGQALTPSSFGATSTTTGVWSPIQYTGTYGTNGFYLNFSDNSNTTAATLGKDYSGNGNNFTPNNFSVTAGAGNDSLVDSPTSYGTDTGVGGEVRGNYCTLNPLQSGITLSNGNLDFTSSSATNLSAYSTIGMSSGKWYCEVVYTTKGSSPSVGISLTTNTNTSSYVGAGASQYAYESGYKINNSTSAVYGTTLSNNEVIGIAFDADAGTITFYQSGVSLGVAFSSIPAGTYVFGVTSYQGTGNINFGQRPFAYTAPSGYKALCTQNLPEQAIGGTSETLASKFFNTVTWTGTGTSSARSITGVGFQPDFVWSKPRSVAYGHNLYDAVRGSGKRLRSDSVDGDVTNPTYGYLSSFNTDGFSTTAGSINNENWNQTSQTYVAWNWKADNNAGSNNRSGSIDSTVSVNPRSGFSIVTYAGNNTNGATIGHGLDAIPSMIILKARSASIYNWRVYHSGLSSNYNLFLNSTSGQAQMSVDAVGYINSSVTASTFSLSVGTSNMAAVNASGVNYLAYCFAEVAGYSKFGSYTGNGSTNGPFVFTGMRPAFILVKCSSTTGPWNIFDNTRSPTNVASRVLYADTSDAEGGIEIDILSNGFKVRDNSGNVNGSGQTYIFMALAEHPFKYSLAR